MSAGVALINYYATALQEDALGEELATVGPSARPYGATFWRVERSTDDLHKHLVLIGFDDKKNFVKFWYGPEMQRFRGRTSGMHHMPLVYEWMETIADGPHDLSPQEAADAPILSGSAS